MIRTLVIVLMLVPWGVRATEIGTQLEKILGNEAYHPHAIEISSGALDDTHHPYHLALVNNDQGALSFYFIGEATDGSVEILDHVEVGSVGARPIWSSEIKKKSAFISVHSSGGCCSHGGMTYQFKLNSRKRLFMIGYEDMNLGFEERDPDSNNGKVYSEDSLSLNLVTGNAIRSHAESEKIEEWTEKSHFKPSWRLFKLRPPVTTKTQRFRVQTNKLWSLQDLEIGKDEFYNWVLNVYEIKK